MASKNKSKTKVAASDDMTMTSQPSAFQLKGSAFTLTIMQLVNTDIAVIKTQLAALVDQTPRFFQHTPVVLDLQKIATSATSFDLAGLLTVLCTFRMVPVGISGGTTEQQEMAIELGLAILPMSKSKKSEECVDNSAVSAVTAIPTVAQCLSKVVTQPVRSGQQIYAKGGDLIVLAPVSAGSELLADGNIHVYGPLRGRALAGINGDTGARIFCQALEAELVAIAGHYWISEDLSGRVNQKKAVQIYLEEGHLRMGMLYSPGVFA